MFGKNGFGKRKNFRGKEQDAGGNNRARSIKNRSSGLGEQRIIHTSQKESIEQLKSIVGRISNIALGQPGSILHNPNFRQLVKDFDSASIQDAILYSENGEEWFSIFASMISQTTMDYLPHEKLFFLVSDLLTLQALALKFDAAIGPEEYHEALTLNVTINASFLHEYFTVLLGNFGDVLIARMSGQENEASESREEILKAAQERYELKIQRIANFQDSYLVRLRTMIETDNMPKLPIIPVVTGNIKNKDTVLNNVYMSKEQGEQMTTWLAKLQADGLRYSHNNSVG